MTVTLEDVAFIYGLPTEGSPVTGSTKATDWAEKVQKWICPVSPVRHWARENRSDCHMMKLRFLRTKFKNGPSPEASEEELDRYTRVLCLHMFGTIMFPDTSHNCVPVYYLDLIEGSLNEERKINWGGAVIACLYRALDRAALKFKKPSGPWLLLLYWAWSYLPVCRPAVGPVKGLGLPDLDSCLPFAWKWNQARTWAKNNHREAVQSARDSLVLMEVDDVNWQPYLEYFRLMPRHAQAGSLSFHLRLPCIHYFEIGWTFPDRCRHQQGLVQAFSPPLPIAWNTMITLYNYNHGTVRKGADWSSVFAPLIAMWDETVLRSQAESVDRRVWSDTNQRKYARYMRETGAAELPVSRAEAYARRRQQPISELQYTPVAPGVHVQGKSAVSTAMEVIGLLAKKDFRRVGKKILRNCRSQLQNASMSFQLEDLLENEGFPQNIDEIADSDTETSVPEDPVQPEDLVQPNEPVQRPQEPIQPHYTQIPASGPTPSQFQASGSTSTSHFAGISYDPTGILSSFMPQYPPYPHYTMFGQPAFPYGGSFSSQAEYTSFSSQPAFGYDPVFSTNP
ncbi:hypothetical protein LUZ63_006750 [Rhynchospora breviuscula]|uniref:Aminotransferase-like plant mobile domain-containing protein n=1 Tax=Rhynchospora breviuscula TaxID=2022672 RepID=A0A9Q0CQR6_9POAL|nr:hypothetical protein LUZ63_006750 [Rhynchospora breviuscula]